MKIHKIIQLFFLLSIFASRNVLAEDFLLEKSSLSKESYGIVDAVYPKESRLLIDDTEIVYRQKSSFFKANGESFYNIKKTLPKGTPVIYQTIEKPNFSILHGLKIISMREYKNSQREDDDD